MSKLLEVPYLSQLDNDLNPSGACNVTSTAMCLSFFGLQGNGSFYQLEDELYQKCIDNDWSRHSPYGLQTLIESYGYKDDFTEHGSLADIRAAIDAGTPCIVHGYFTGFGHIIVIKGYDDAGFVVNDPYGEWHPWEYNTSVSGEGVHYSSRAIAACCGSFSQGEAIEVYERLKTENVEQSNTIWLHRVSK